MTKTRFTQTTRLFALLVLAFTVPAIAAFPSAAESGPASRSPQAPSSTIVTLRAASGATLPFMTQNGTTVNGVLSQAHDVPYLVLYRNGALTRADERTLILEVSGITAPATGVTVTLEIETQHQDPDFDGQAGPRLAVWRESRWIARNRYASQTGARVVFVHEFGATVPSGAESIATPTDYFRYEITVTDADHPSMEPLHTLSGDYAFLMENQWVARLPEVREESPGAAPDELVVYTCDMFPFRKDGKDPSTWLPREEVTAYVGSELLPQMVEAFRVQSDEWGFPWTPAWTSYRAQDAERLSVALGEGQTWFHGPAPSRGSAEISIKVAGGDNAEYDTLADGILSTFHHELFHNLQRNLNLSLGGDGQVGGEGNRWKFYSEGTAVLASSVGQPLVHLGPSSQRRAYLTYANRYLVWSGGRFQDMIANHDQVDPYYAALYWRFLFEQCGGMREGVQDPAAGMQVVRRALTALYSGEIVDIASSANLVEATPEVLDRALAGSSCPFQTYKESLVAFSRAVYGLRVEGGRCVGPGLPAGCGLYDPHHLYQDPPVETIVFNGATREVRHEVMGPWGTDSIEVVFAPAANGGPLTLELRLSPPVDAELSVQLVRSREDMEPRHTAEVLAETNREGHLFYAIPETDIAVDSRLGLIITRLDAQEASEPMGEYTIVLQPGVGHAPEAAGDLAHDVQP